MSQYREQSQVGRFTPRPHFIVITILRVGSGLVVRIKVRVKVGVSIRAEA